MTNPDMETWLDVARKYTHNKRMFLIIFKNAHGKVAIKKASATGVANAWLTKTTL